MEHIGKFEQNNGTHTQQADQGCFAMHLTRSRSISLVPTTAPLPNNRPEALSALACHAAAALDWARMEASLLLGWTSAPRPAPVQDPANAIMRISNNANDVSFWRFATKVCRFP